jgi:hypothetical protein
VVQDQIGGESWPGSSSAFERTRSLSCGASRPEERPSGRSLDPGREAGARGMIVTVRASKLAAHRIRLTGSPATKAFCFIEFASGRCRSVQKTRNGFSTDLRYFPSNCVLGPGVPRRMGRNAFLIVSTVSPSGFATQREVSAMKSINRKARMCSLP